MTAMKESGIILLATVYMPDDTVPLKSLITVYFSELLRDTDLCATRRTFGRIYNIYICGGVWPLTTM